MRRSILLIWLLVGAGCAFNPGAAQQEMMEANMRAVQKDYAGAIGLYDQALQNDPYLAEACLYRGIAFRGNGNFDRALEDIDQSIAMGLDGSRVYAERARTKLAKLAAEAAGDKAKLAAAFAPADPLGISADLDHAADLDPKFIDGPAMLLRGAVRIMQGREAEAQRDFDRFLLTRPKARQDVVDAIQKWKNDRPVLDLAPIDALGRIPSRALRKPT
jgi:tetratricopeptide (TPR) repeat protein